LKPAAQIVKYNCMAKNNTDNKSLFDRKAYLLAATRLCIIISLVMTVPLMAWADAGKPVWAPAGSLPEGFDWIQLTSGEWLKGDLKVLYNDSLEFDSDELDLLKFDWEDVQQVICHAPQSVRIEDPEAKRNNWLNVEAVADTVVGILRIDGDRVIVETDEGAKEFNRSSLVSIASGKTRELDYWAIKFALSVDISGGNSEQEDYNANLNMKRRTSLTRFSLDYNGIYSTTSGILTANSNRANSYFDIFATRQFFWRPVFVEYFRDTFANIAHRGTIGAGLGYTIVHTAKTEWLVSPNIAYMFTKYDSVEAGEDDTSSTPAFVFSTEFDTELTKKIDFDALYNFYVVNEESGTYTHHAKASLEIELTGRLDLDMSVIWDRIQDPQPDSDGFTPKQDDIYLFFGISFEL